MNLSLKNKHALVCGASSGIGKASALALAAQGASVTALARREELLDELLPLLKEAGAASAHKIVADLEDREDLENKISAHLEAQGPVHIWLNNTGGPPGGPLLHAKVEELQTAFSRHVLAAQTLLQLLLPGMQAEGYGRIINIISTSVREPIPNLGVSNTVRGAMASWAKTLSKELPPGLTINNILPGYTDTPRLGDLKAGVARRLTKPIDEVHAMWVGQIPEGRLATPEELANAVVFLASEAGAYIRGVSLPVDGGRLNSI